MNTKDPPQKKIETGLYPMKEIIEKETEKGKLKILIAEDNPTNLILLEKMLSPYGPVNTAVNGQDAIDAFREAIRQGEPYDLICLDIMMPVKNGQAALKEIRDIEKQEGTLPAQAVKIIITTILEKSQDIMKPFEKICNGHLSKPIRQDKLLELLHEFGMLR